MPDSSTEPERYAVSDPDPVPFPTFDEISDGCSSNKLCEGVSRWDCTTASGGTSDGACSAKIIPPTVSCGTLNGAENVNTEPVESGDNLCKVENGGGVFADSGIQFDEETGKWTWDCKHDPFEGITASCEALSCIANNPINFTSPIMLTDGDMYSQISLNCPGANNLCCKISGTELENSIPEVVVCGNDTAQLQIIEGSTNTFNPVCWFEEGCATNCTSDPDCDPSSEKCVNIPDFKVTTACVQSQCTASGTCAKTPKPATSRSECSNTCNSNADCASGRIIETKP